MLTRTHQKIGLLLSLSDALGLLASWALAYYLRFHTEIITVTKGIPLLSVYIYLAVPIILVWFLVFHYFHLYGYKALLKNITPVVELFSAHGLALLIFLALLYFHSEYYYSRVVVIYFGFLSGVYLLGSRLLLSKLLRYSAEQWDQKKPILIVGMGKTAQAMVSRIENNPELRLSIQGFLHQGGEAPDSPYPVLGGYDDILSVVKEQHIQKVLIALPREEAKFQTPVLESLSKTTVELGLVPDTYEYVVLSCKVEDFDGIPVINLNEAPINLSGKIAKRVLDISFSLLAIALFAPVMLIICIAIKLTSKGPILYRQQRMSLDGHLFSMWKFRSMHVGAEDTAGPVWAASNDSRRTSLGTFLRTTSLDELPQFFNVLGGNMSLVGPRPERPNFVDEFRHSIPKYMYRHKIKSGITGWAQINGLRGNTSLEKRLELDLYYIKNWSLLLDIKILLLTPIKSLADKNAY